MEELLEGHKSHNFTSNDLVDSWKEIFCSSRDGLKAKMVNPSTVQENIWRPVTVAELLQVKISKRTYCGPDGISARMLNAMNHSTLCAFYNLVLAVGYLPKRLQRSVTIFIPKKDELQSPMDCRPISVTSVVVRQHHRIFARRMQIMLPWDDRQRGFLPTDGCADNNMLISAVIKEARQQLKPLYIASLDIKKAFDTVDHSATWEALRAQGCSAPFLRYLFRYQKAGVTSLIGKDGVSENISLTRGVRQGDPISPYVFNSVINQMLVQLPKDIRFQVGNVLINSTALAYDINLIASSATGIQQLIDNVHNFLKPRCLEINPLKSKILALIPDCKKKKMFVETEYPFFIKDLQLQAVHVDEKFRYLGVDINTYGKISTNEVYEDYLVRLTKGPLKPQQRLALLREFVVPKLLFGLKFANPPLDQLKKIDRMTRAYCKKWLLLPDDTPTAFFHTSVKDGGLGLMDFRWMILRICYDMINKIKTSVQESVAIISKTHHISQMEIRTRKKMQDVSSYITTIDEQKDRWRQLLYKSVDGNGLKEANKAHGFHRWIDDGSSLLSGKDFIQSSKLRINALPTRGRTTRGREVAKKCRGCGQAIETMQHVLQRCQKTHNSRIERHDKLVRLVVNLIRRDNRQLLVEPHFHTEEEIRKPDIIVKQGNLATVLDVQVVNDFMPLSKYYAEKVKYYSNNGSLRTKIQSSLNVTSITFKAITINWRGIVAKETATCLEKLDVKKSSFNIIAVRAIQGSLYEWGIFNKAT